MDVCRAVRCEGTHCRDLTQSRDIVPVCFCLPRLLPSVCRALGPGGG